MLEVQWEDNYKKNKQELINQVTEIPYWETEDLSLFWVFCLLLCIFYWKRDGLHHLFQVL